MALSKKAKSEPKPDWMLGPMLRHQQQSELLVASLRPAFVAPVPRERKPDWLLTQTILSPRKKKASANTGPSPTVRAGVIARDRRCVCCGRDCVGGIPGFDFSIQHILARGAGGSSDETINDPSMLLLLCGHALSGCHGRTESQRNWARKQGYARKHGIHQHEGTVHWHGLDVTLTSDFRVFDATTGEEVFA